MTVYTATRTTRQPSDRPTWLQRWLGNLPGGDEVSPIEVLRAEFHTALANERAERQTLVTKLSAVRTTADATERDLKATRDELARSRDHGKAQANTIQLLDSTIKSLQATLEHNTAELTALIGSNGALQEALRRMEADHRVDQETIAVLRAEIAEMRGRQKVSEEETARARNQALVSDAKARILEDENTRLRSQVVALGGTPA